MYRPADRLARPRRLPRQRSTSRSRTRGLTAARWRWRWSTSITCGKSTIAWDTPQATASCERSRGSSAPRWMTTLPSPVSGMTTSPCCCRRPVVARPGRSPRGYARRSRDFVSSKRRMERTAPAITLSLGAATYPADAEAAADLIKRAGEALDQARSFGRKPGLVLHAPAAGAAGGAGLLRYVGTVARGFHPRSVAERRVRADLGPGGHGDAMCVDLRSTDDGRSGARRRACGAQPFRRAPARPAIRAFPEWVSSSSASGRRTGAPSRVTCTVTNR